METHPKYMPLLALRPAEMWALKELPAVTKSRILPVVQMRPWVSSLLLRRSVEALDRAYPDRNVIVDLEVPAENVASERPVHEELRALGLVDNGYANWCSFIAENERYIPCLQVFDKENLERQVVNLLSLGRGMAVRVGYKNVPSLDYVLSILNRRHNDHNQIYIIFDFGQWTLEPLVNTAVAIQLVRAVQAKVPTARITLAATSFPKAFVDRYGTPTPAKEIIERTFFELCRPYLNEPILIYGDYGSVALDRASGGAGAPPPRIDYPTRSRWNFYRKPIKGSADRAPYYAAAAKEAVDSPAWDDNLLIWGTQMIKRTSMGDVTAINSANRSTAVRINIHMHLQAFFEDPKSRIYDTDEPWSD